LEKEAAFISELAFWLFGGACGMGKVAVVTVELVGASVAESNDAIAEELLEWFKNQAVPVPWVKKVKKVVVEGF
jgi:hypothetical protein